MFHELTGSEDDLPNATLNDLRARYGLKELVDENNCTELEKLNLKPIEISLVKQEMFESEEALTKSR
jgi:hypothetical protein